MTTLTNNAIDGTNKRGRPREGPLIPEEDTRAILEARSPALQKLAEMASQQGRYSQKDLLLRQISETAWDQKHRSMAACRGLDPELFFIEVGSKVIKPKAVCADCSVRLYCLKYALDNNIDQGVWGGTSQRERRALRAKLKEGVSLEEVAPVIQANPQQYRLIISEKGYQPNSELEDKVLAFLASYRKTGFRVENCADIFKQMSDLVGEACESLIQVINHLEKNGLIKLVWTKSSEIKNLIAIRLTTSGELEVVTKLGNAGNDQALSIGKVKPIILDFCQSLADRGGDIKSPGGYCAGEIRRMGFERADAVLREARDLGLIIRDTDYSRTYRVELTELGWIIIGSRKKNA